MEIIVNDTLGNRDSLNNEKPHGLRGVVIARNRFGKKLFQKDNLVVLKGRLFVLEKIFNLKTITDNAHTNPVEQNELDNRGIFLFGIGNGGMESINTLNSLKPVVYNDNDLASPLDFQRELSTDRYDENSRVNNTYCIGETLNNRDRFINADKKNVFGYRYKLIENDKSIIYGGENAVSSNFSDEVYIELNCKISATDLQWMSDNNLNGNGVENVDEYTNSLKYFNELGLFIGTPISITETATNETTGESKEITLTDYKNIELFSRLTFNTIDLITEKEITFTYRIYVV